LCEDHEGNLCLIKSDKEGHQLWQAIQQKLCSWRFNDYGTMEHIVKKWRAYKQAPVWMDRECSSHDHAGNWYYLTGTEENVENSRFKCIAEYNEATREYSFCIEKMSEETKSLFL